MRTAEMRNCSAESRKTRFVCFGSNKDGCSRSARRQLDARLKRVDDDLERIDAELAELANMDARPAERLAILRIIPGVGDVTA